MRFVPKHGSTNAPSTELSTTLLGHRNAELAPGRPLASMVCAAPHVSSHCCPADSFAQSWAVGYVIECVTNVQPYEASFWANAHEVASVSPSWAHHRVDCVVGPVSIDPVAERPSWCRNGSTVVSSRATPASSARQDAPSAAVTSVRENISSTNFLVMRKRALPVPGPSVPVTL